MSNNNIEPIKPLQLNSFKIRLRPNSYDSEVRMNGEVLSAVKSVRVWQSVGEIPVVFLEIISDDIEIDCETPAEENENLP